MIEQELMDIESAYGSETSSNPDSLIKKDTTEEPSTRKSRYQWIKHKLREYMVLEAVVLLILLFLLVTCCRITSQNQETQKMISGIKSELNSLQKLVRRDFMDLKQETKKVDENESKKTKEEFSKEVKLSVQPVPSQSTHAPTIVPTVPTNSTFKRFNAASLLAGATIEKSLSSSSNLNPFIGFDQSNLVLVDRPDPPSSKAWCTFEKNPVLTVDLGRYINPTAVSYQHSNWNGTIPDDAPKEYSVVACLDTNCLTRKPLFSHCEYNPHGSQEQICNNISNDSINSPVAKLQFLFHKNQQDTERTCVSLIRVYSDKEVVQEQKIRRLEDTTTCLDLKRHYHHNPLTYKFFTYKNCAVLYSKECCQDCPECCEECEIKDINPDVILQTFVFGLLIPTVCIFFLVVVISTLYQEFMQDYRRNAN